MYYKVMNSSLKFIEIIEGSTSEVFNKYKGFQVFCRKDDLYNIKKNKKTVKFSIKDFGDFLIVNNVLAKITKLDNGKKRYSYTGFPLSFTSYIMEYIDTF